MNGIYKYVTETTETIVLEGVEHRVTRKPDAKARPQLRPVVTLSLISIPLGERNWIDITPERFRQDCFTVSKAMIRLQRVRLALGTLNFEPLSSLCFRHPYSIFLGIPV